jgi:hypothetical protein
VSGFDVDEEQHVVAAKRGCVDGEEVAGDRGLECRNCDQVTSEHFGAGSMPLSWRICHTVEEEIVWPRPMSSPWMVDLSAQNRELVAQHDDLEVLGPARADSETGEHGDETVENTRHGAPGWSGVGPGQPTRPDFRPPQAPTANSSSSCTNQTPRVWCPERLSLRVPVEAWRPSTVFSWRNTMI